MDTIRERRSPLNGKLTVGIGITVLAGIATVSSISLFHGSNGVTIDRTAIVTDTVSRGTLERSIAASGTFASENVRIVDAVEPGVVETVFVKPGAHVNAGDAIAHMSDPDLEASVVDARSALDVARAQLISAQQQSKASALSQQSTLAGAQAQMQEDDANAASLASLHGSGYVAESTYRIAMIKRAQSHRQVTINRSQIDVEAADQQAKIAAAQAQVEQATAVLAAKQTEEQLLDIRAGASGVVQSVDVDPGVRVDAGTEVAKIADQSALKAVLDVPEGQAHDVAIGMRTTIDTGNGSAVGRVERIAPSAQNGSVAVDIAFDHALASARPDLTVEGTISLESIPHALSIARPAGAIDGATISLFKLNAQRTSATPVQVHLGRGSVDRVQVLSGLDAGDVVVVSDMSSYDSHTSVHIR